MNNKHRMLFYKEGLAQYISHLDLMRTMQRVFIRSGLSVKHTEGFNPHPFISIALPLSVGCESQCELMDFELLSDIPLEKVPEMMNASMPSGITVVKVYEAERKLKEIAWLEICGLLTYDKGVPDSACGELNSLFTGDNLVIQKKSKKGITDFDIIPCINAILFSKLSDTGIFVRAVISAQNPALNPNNIISAIEQKKPFLAPDFTEFKRMEVLDSDMNVFR